MITLSAQGAFLLAFVAVTIRGVAIRLMSALVLVRGLSLEQCLSLGLQCSAGTKVHQLPQSFAAIVVWMRSAVPTARLVGYCGGAMKILASTMWCFGSAPMVPEK